MYALREWHEETVDEKGGGRSGKVARVLSTVAAIRQQLAAKRSNENCWAQYLQICDHQSKVSNLTRCIERTDSTVEWFVQSLQTVMSLGQSIPYTA